VKPRKPLPRPTKPLERRTPLPRSTKPLKRKPLPRRTKPIRRSKYRPQVRVGKLGIVRLSGPAKTCLRHECFDRDRYRCVDCGRTVAWDQTAAEALAELGMYFPIGEMSHRTSVGAGGSDVLSNVVTRCRDCHQKSHNAGGKPVARKP